MFYITVCFFYKAPLTSPRVMKPAAPHHHTIGIDFAHQAMLMAQAARPKAT
jgi:hypothetical protein